MDEKKCQKVKWIDENMVRMYNGVSSFFRPHHNRKIIQYSKIRQNNHLSFCLIWSDLINKMGKDRSRLCYRYKGGSLFLSKFNILDTVWYLSFDSEQISTKTNLIPENYFEGLLIYKLNSETSVVRHIKCCKIIYMWKTAI